MSWTDSYHQGCVWKANAALGACLEARGDVKVFLHVSPQHLVDAAGAHLRYGFALQGCKLQQPSQSVPQLCLHCSTLVGRHQSDAQTQFEDKQITKSYALQCTIQQAGLIGMCKRCTRHQHRPQFGLQQLVSISVEI